MSLDPRRLQRHLRESLRRQSPATRAGSFTCYLHPQSADPTLNVAVPDEPPEGRRVPVLENDAAPPETETDALLALAQVKALFAVNGRRPRVEFLDECHPGLAAALEASGFREDARTSLLACTRESWRQVDARLAVSVEPVLPETPWPVARRYLDVQREAYKLDMPLPEEEPPGFWSALQLGAGLLVLVDGEPAAAGGVAPAEDGLADVRGLAVREPFRRRGLGSFLLSALARLAHGTGIEAVIAIPDGVETQRLGERAGFVPAATLRSFTAAGAAAP